MLYLLVIASFLPKTGIHSSARRAQIAHDDDIARLEGGDEFGFHIGQEVLAVDRAIEDPGRFNPIMTQGGDEGPDPPVAVRNDGLDPLATLAPATKRSHVRLRPGLIDEHQPPGIDQGSVLGPLLTSPGDVGPTALARDQRPFLKLSYCSCRKFQTLW